MARATANFDGSDLATSVPGLSVIATNTYRPPTRVVDTAKIANTDRSVSPSAYYQDKKLNAVVEMGRDSRELLDDSIDTLKALLQPRESPLILSVGTGLRQWTATYSNMTISEVQGGHCIIDIEWLAADPIGINNNVTGLFTSAFTGANRNIPFNAPFAGTAQWQQPILEFVYNSLSGGTGATVTIGNPLNGQQITITRNWVAGDSLLIDCREGQAIVEVNGTEVAFTGSIPSWITGQLGSLDYSDTLTTRNVSASGTYYKRYV